jgi:hypothetical protein
MGTTQHECKPYGYEGTRVQKNMGTKKHGLKATWLLNIRVQSHMGTNHKGMKQLGYKATWVQLASHLNDSIFVYIRNN